MCWKTYFSIDLSKTVYSGLQATVGPVAFRNYCLLVSSRKRCVTIPITDLTPSLLYLPRISKHWWPLNQGKPLNIFRKDINKRLQGNRMWIKDYITHSTQVSFFVRSASTNSSGYLLFSEDSSFKGLTFVSFARLRTVPRTMYSPESTSCLTTCIAK